MPETTSDPDEVKAEIQRRWGMNVWSEVLGFSIAALIIETTDKLLKEHA